MRIQIDNAIVTKAFEKVCHDESLAESKALHDAGLPVVEMLQAMAMRPEILASFATFGNAVYPGGILDRPLKEKIILRASLQNECQFCTQSHISLMKHLEISNNPVNSVLDSSLLTDREKIALRYTEIVTGDSNRVTDEIFQELKLHFIDTEIVEITFLIGFINMLNRFNNALDIKYRDDYEQM